MSCCSSGCGSGCSGCKVLMALVALVLTLTTIAAIIGVYQAHMSAAGMVFGSLNGSVALLTLVASLLAWVKVVKKLCPCRSNGGMCPGCGHSPCTCR